jgi:hypothetical protein
LTESDSKVVQQTFRPDPGKTTKLEVIWPDANVVVGPIPSKAKRKGKRGENPATKVRRGIIRSIARSVPPSRYCELVDSRGLRPPWPKCPTYAAGWSSEDAELRDKIKQERKNAWRALKNKG